jgi:hypothetical protein
MLHHIRSCQFCLIFATLFGGHISSGICAQTESDIFTEFSIKNEKLTLHEPVVLTFKIVNKAGSVVHYDLGRDRKENFAFTVTMPNGDAIQLPRLRRNGFTRGGNIAIMPGQTYSQQILLNEWLDLKTQGQYKITAGLLPPEKSDRVDSGAAAQVVEVYRGSFEIGPRNEQTLTNLCQDLALGIENSSSYEEAAQFALELSYVNDEIAVPYLQRALLSNKLVEMFAIQGLERIATIEAVKSLSLGLTIQFHNTSLLARSALQRIESSSSDHAIKEEIQRILKT